MRKRLRVLWTSDSPLAGIGFGRVSREILIRLDGLDLFELACLGWSYNGWPYDRIDFPLTIYPSPDGKHASHAFERVVKEFSPDIVITLGEIWMIDWLANHSERPKFKWIAYVPVDSGPFYPPHAETLREVDALVAMSEFGRRIFSEGMPGKEVAAILHGVNTKVFKPLAEREHLKKHKRIAGKFVIGCVARNQPRKNIPSLVKAFSALSKKQKNLHLFLHMNALDVGCDLVTLLKRHGLEGCADLASPEHTINSPLGDEQLNRLYNIFDITVLPSFGEGFGLPIIESMAAGVPVAATNYSACTELVQRRGELVKVITTVTVGMNLLEQAVIDVDDLAAKIEKLYRNPELVREYSRKGREFAESLDWDRIVPQWVELIDKVAGRN